MIVIRILCRFASKSIQIILTLFSRILELNKVGNISVELSQTNSTVAFIYFTRPRDYFDNVRLDCFVHNQTCTHSSSYLTGNIYSTCQNCTHITIAPIETGIEYQCWANISRASISSTSYHAIDFNTSK